MMRVICLINSIFIHKVIISGINFLHLYYALCKIVPRAYHNHKPMATPHNRKALTNILNFFNSKNHFVKICFSPFFFFLLTVQLQSVQMQLRVQPQLAKNLFLAFDPGIILRLFSMSLFFPRLTLPGEMKRERRRSQGVPVAKHLCHSSPGGPWAEIGCAETQLESLDVCTLLSLPHRGLALPGIRIETERLELIILIPLESH